MTEDSNEKSSPFDKQLQEILSPGPNRIKHTDKEQNEIANTQNISDDIVKKNEKNGFMYKIFSLIRLLAALGVIGLLALFGIHISRLS